MMLVAEKPDEMTLIDQLLAEQRSLTAVERFSRWHEEVPATGHYRNLLPASAPAPGQQYAFEVNLDTCSGCKACVTACHALNGLDETETWRSVGILVPEGLVSEAKKIAQPAFQQHVTTACHHCVDPGCLNGCPVLAYDKDPITGIVRHLDDQCIGCQYCVMKCPYDVPKYSERLGIVRKCDMCANRLAVGEAPACVQSCPNEAIHITLVEREKVEAGYRAKTMVTPSPSVMNLFLPGSPDPVITVPTTQYLTNKQFAQKAVPADLHEVRPATAHTPLTLMLVLTQAGVGISLMDALFGRPNRVVAGFGFLLASLGMVAATLHLGQPMKAWRGFLGWRKSWLSRELIVFGGFMGLLGLHVLMEQPLTAWAAAVTGVLGVICSAMIYVDTRRPYWSAPFTFAKFILTTFLLGVAGVLIAGAADEGFAGKSFALGAAGYGVSACGLLSILTLMKLGVEYPFLRFAKTAPESALGRTARLHFGALNRLFRVRLFTAFFGGVFFPGMVVAGLVKPDLGILFLIFVCALAGELVERHLFFVAEAAPKMPGGI